LHLGERRQLCARAHQLRFQVGKMLSMLLGMLRSSRQLAPQGNSLRMRQLGTCGELQKSANMGFCGRHWRKWGSQKYDTT
jgi:hypothetical protein